MISVFHIPSTCLCVRSWNKSGEALHSYASPYSHDSPSPIWPDAAFAISFKRGTSAKSRRQRRCWTRYRRRYGYSKILWLRLFSRVFFIFIIRELRLVLPAQGVILRFPYALNLRFVNLLLLSHVIAMRRFRPIFRLGWLNLLVFHYYYAGITGENLHLISVHSLRRP